MDFTPWGAKSDARYPCGQGNTPSRLSVEGFSFTVRAGVSPFFPNEVPAPFQRHCLAHSLWREVLGTIINLGRSFSCQEVKKKPIHRRANPSGSLPLAGVLVWLSMYRLKSRIQFSHQCGAFILAQKIVNIVFYIRILLLKTYHLRFSI